MGFTPINVPRVTRSQGKDGRHAQNVPPQRPVPLTERKAKSTASEYLGRSPQGDAATDVKTRSGPTLPTQKTASRGKKRTSAAQSQASAKRRKNSDVSQNMSVTKSAAQRKKNVKDPDSSVRTQTKTDPNFPSGSFEVDRAENSTSAYAQSVSIYAPETSMHSLQLIHQQTSLDAMKSSLGRSKTLYRGVGVAMDEWTGVQFTQPWMSSSIVASRHVDVPLDCLNPRAVSQHDKTTATEISRDSSAAATAERDFKIHSDVATGWCDNEDFIGEDDEDMAEVIELVDNAVMNGEAKCTERPILEATEQLPTPVNSDSPINSDLSADLATARVQTRKRKPTRLQTLDEEFTDINAEDEAMITDLTSPVDESAPLPRSRTPPPRDRKLNIRAVEPNEDYSGGLLSEAEQELLNKLKTASKNSTIKPIIRKPFPSSIPDRSPLFGVSNNTILRTCFRIGEALNVASHATRVNQNMILELYARVTSSHRDGRKQHLVFHDLYHDRSPYLEGVFELWQQSALWDLDGKAFLTQREGGLMCRVMAKMKRERSTKQWKLEVLSIWEADWEDVTFVAGIYSKDGYLFSDD